MLRPVTAVERISLCATGAGEIPLKTPRNRPVKNFFHRFSCLTTVTRAFNFAVVAPPRIMACSDIGPRASRTS